MGARSKHSAPRSMVGGRGPRYERRRTARGTEATLAPAWSDAAAAAVLTALHNRNGNRPSGLVRTVLAVLRDQTAIAAFVHELRARLSTADRELAQQVLQFHAGKVAACDSDATEKLKVRAFLKPLRERRVLRVAIGVLEIPAHEGPVRGLVDWISLDPRTDRVRDISASQRVVMGLAAWDLEWLAAPGVVCYERAKARVDSERNGVCNASFARALVHTTLPTATANASDHYILLQPNTAPRFLSVNECARAFGVDESGPMFRMLTANGPLTPNQAVSCLGRAVHAGVARQIVRTLVARGVVAAGMRYGSDCSGVDLFAAAVHAELGASWTYVFASEREAHVRSGLIAAWGPLGLTAAAVATDACRPPEDLPPPVDLYDARLHGTLGGESLALDGGVGRVARRHLRYARVRQPSPPTGGGGRERR